jgi:outer membrane protein OmpA-like peptidoglycan-associated protein
MVKDLATDGRTRVYGINFDFGSDVIRSESTGTLDQIVAVLRENAGWTMTVEGHTDSVGGDAANQRLSERRADAVRLHLVNAGIEPARLTTAGFGMSKPVAANTDAIGRAQNRRVELARR